MGFNFTCPFCKEVMQCEDAWAGLPGKCPSCGRDILMNPPAPEDSPGAAKLSQCMPREEDSPPVIEDYTPSPAYYAKPKQSWLSLADLGHALGIVLKYAFYGLVALGMAWGYYHYYRYIKIPKEAAEAFKGLIEARVEGAKVTSSTVSGVTKTGPGKYAATAAVTVIGTNTDTVLKTGFGNPSRNLLDGSIEYTFKIKIDRSKKGETWVGIDDCTELPGWLVIGWSKSLGRDTMEKALARGQLGNFRLTHMTIIEVSNLGEGKYKGTLSFTATGGGETHNASIDYTLFFNGDNVEFETIPGTYREFRESQYYNQQYYRGRIPF